MILPQDLSVQMKRPHRTLKCSICGNPTNSSKQINTIMESLDPAEI
jgi:hypothetical protein